MKILFTVCGRAGSKGIKHKNVKKFLEFPLPYYTFAVIDLFTNKFTEDDISVAVNTDSLELMELARTNPFITIEIIERKYGLEGDQVPKSAVILDTLLEMEKICHVTYDMVVDLDLTSHLRTVDDLRQLIDTQKKKNCDVTFSVTKARRNPFFNMVMETDRGVCKILESDFVARQQAPAVYDMNASLYAYRPQYLKSGKGVLDGYCEIIKMTDTGILDLDHESDFELMEVVAKYLFNTKKDFKDIYQYMIKAVRKIEVSNDLRTES